MIKVTILPELVRLVEETRDSEIEMNSAFTVSHVRDLDATQVKPVIDYLLHPYEYGYWNFGGAWRYNAPIFIYLLAELGTLDELEGAAAHQGAPALMRQLSEEKKEELVHVTSRLSGLYFLFLSAKRSTDNQSLPKLHDKYSWIKRIDLEKFRSEFASSCDIFDRRIHNAKFKAGVGPRHRVLPAGCGLVNYSESPRTRGRISVASATKLPLQALCDFYNELEIISNSVIERVFSPDEKLFAPYFEFLNRVFSYVILDERANSFAQAFDYYVNLDYTHCISTLGLIAEDYLTRIYVTLLREQCTPGLTLGQLNDLLHKRVVEIVVPQKAGLKSVDAIYAKIASISESDDKLAHQAIYREFLSVIKEDRAYFSSKIEDLSKATSKVSPFPGSVKDNLTELLRFRNAASHNTRVPLGEFEALRTLYCLVSLVSWWQDFLTDNNWELEKKEILISAIEKTRKK